MGCVYRCWFGVNLLGFELFWVWVINGLLFCGGCFDLVAFGLVLMLHFMNWFVAFRFPLVLF